MKPSLLKELYESGEYDRLEKEIEKRYKEKGELSVSEKDLKAFDKRLQGIIKDVVLWSKERCETIKGLLLPGEQLSFSCSIIPGKNERCSDWEYIRCPDCKLSYSPLLVFSFVGYQKDHITKNCEVLDYKGEYKGIIVHRGTYHLLEHCYIPPCDLLGIEGFDISTEIDTWKTV